VLQHLQFKHLFFNIDELQLQIQLLHLGYHCLLLLSVTRRNSKDSAITPETTQTHPPSGMVNCRATRSLVAELRMLNDGVTEKHKLVFSLIQITPYSHLVLAVGGHASSIKDVVHIYFGKILEKPQKLDMFLGK